MKSMNLKRFASMVLASVMALALTVPAFAAAATSTITGNYAEITLSVTVPDSGEAVINPYGLPYKMGDFSVTGQKIVTTAPLLIQNKSTAPLSVSAKVTGTAGTGVTLLANSGNFASGETTKELKVQFQAFEALTVNADNASDKDTLIPLFIALKDSDAALTADVTTSAVDAAGTLVLREGKDGELQNGGAAFFRLAGEAAKKATWAETDTFSAKIAFTFEPYANGYSRPAGSIAGASGATAVNNAGTLEVTLTPSLPTGVTVTTWTWQSSDESALTVEAKATPADGTVATVTNKVATATGTAHVTGVVITATGTGSDGLPYSATITLQATGNP